jgi:hypothetical protein
MEKDKFRYLSSGSFLKNFKNRYNLDIPQLTEDIFEFLDLNLFGELIDYFNANKFTEVISKIKFCIIDEPKFNLGDIISVIKGKGLGEVSQTSTTEYYLGYVYKINYNNVVYHSEYNLRNATLDEMKLFKIKKIFLIN